MAKYTARLDKILEAETKTADLNINGELVGEFVGAGEIKIATLALDGLADYDRANGFVAGDMDISWGTYKLAHDRGREFSIDAMDDGEHLMLVTANAMAEFARTKVIPEVDAIRFATLTEKAGATATGALTKDTVLDALMTAEEAVGEHADVDGAILYTTLAVKNLIRRALPYRMGQGENPNGKFETFDDMKIVTVPTSRFYSAVDLLDGKTTGETEGGYKKADAGAPINFMIVKPEAAAAIQRHEKLRYFAPDVNQEKDAHKWQYRLFHDLLVYEGKKSLIYAHLNA